MSGDTAIRVENVSMLFNLTREKVDTLKEYAVRFLRRQIQYEEFWALRDVSFEVKKGEVFGIMGLNGAGKSTLLRIIAGVFKPTAGKVTVTGVVAPMIELGMGFDYEFTARENVYMNGAMFGHDEKYMEGIYQAIVDFSELDGFLDVPLKNFSTGMVARLAFAIATNIEPDILIADEVMGVGDYKFQEKCQRRIESMIARGVTVLLVSHSIETVKGMCSRALLLDKGKMAALGDVADVCREYEKV